MRIAGGIVGIFLAVIILFQSLARTPVPHPPRPSGAVEFVREDYARGGREGGVPRRCPGRSGAMEAGKSAE